MRDVSRLFAGLLVLLPWVSLRAADPPLKYISTIISPRLQAVVSVDISQDGRHAYTAAYQAKTIGVYSRNPDTGLLTEIEAITNPALLDGMTAVRLSPDNKWAITAAFRSQAVVLYARDAQTGKLTMVDSIKHGNNTKALLDWAIDAAWSPDSQFAYVIASNSAAVNVFRITTKPGLEFVEAEKGEGNCFAGARGIALSPDGKFAYISSDRANTLTALKRDATTGELQVLEILKDGQTQATALSGAFSVAVSPDGQYLYLSSGRFQGKDAVSVYRIQKDGKLELVEEMFNFTNKLERFVGGNEIALARDGKRAYAVASRSDSLVVFDRDAATGKLKQTQYLVDQFRGVGAMALPGGLAVSPDGQFIYVAAEGSNGVTIFQTNTQKPAIAEKKSP